jgi:TPR repeat protein
MLVSVRMLLLVSITISVDATLGSPPILADIPTASGKEAGNAHNATSLFEQGEQARKAEKFSEAARLYMKADGLGSIEAAIELGQLYADGKGVERNLKVANSYFLRAQAAKAPRAFAAQAYVVNRLNFRENRAKAREIIARALDQGLTFPFYKDGETLTLYTAMAGYVSELATDGELQDPKARIEWLNKAIALGDTAAMAQLSYHYDKGAAVPRDQQLALQWAKRAADQGSPYGRKLLGELRKKYSGAETAKDLYERAGELDKRNEFAAAADVYARAVELEAPYSGFAAGSLGFMYMSGKGVTQDYSASIRMFKKQLELAKEQWWAYTSLSFVYRKRQPGGFEGEKLARNALQEGIDRGYNRLHKELGEIERDNKRYREAIEIFQRGIEADDPGSMAALGEMYRDGLGVAKNLGVALYWGRRAQEAQEYYGTMLIDSLRKEGVTAEVSPPPDPIKVARANTTFQDGMLAEESGNYDKALEMYLQVAKFGIEEYGGRAFARIGGMYSFGKGLPTNDQVAQQFFQLAADSGISTADIKKVRDTAEPDKKATSPEGHPAPSSSPTSAQASPAVTGSALSSSTSPDAGPAPAPSHTEVAKDLLETGYKAYQNGHYTRAFRMFREAAQKGNAQAQYESAEMLIEGQGVEKDRATGKQWLTLAVMQGNADAKQLQARVEAEDAGKSKEAAAAPKLPEPVAPVASITPAILERVEPTPPVEPKPLPIPITEKRVALVIGNAAYPGGAALANPRNDAEDLGSALRKVGFDVVSGTDLTQRAFADTMAQFTSKAEGADVALVYYAGHAMQLDGENWLLPVDVRADTALNVRLTSLPLQTVVGEVENRVKTTLVFLDACRNNPIEEALKARLRQSKRGFSETRGLARVTVASPDTLVVFATQPNATAADGKGRNSPFTEALLENITTPGVEIETLMKRVSAAVGQKTGQTQEPERLSRLKSEFYFVPVN